MNSICLTGRIVKDVETYSCKDGQAYANFTVVSNDGSEEDKTLYVSCCAFGKMAEALQKHGRKGLSLTIFGYLKNNKYKNANGDMVESLCIVCRNIVWFFPKTQKNKEKED